ncbi:MAG: redox-regulated ATPase YchF [Candidatus Aminicenantes bacterium]|nr:redox-regulated ATPase YchF [Candidatus Aminicenantes bacterium]
MILTIFGYAKTGKTLLFNLLTEKKEKVDKFSAASTEFHKAVVDVPDPRLEKLAAFSGTPPVHARIEFLDAGAISLGEVKNSTFLDLLRRADGLVHLVRAFADEEIVHPQGTVDPGRDIAAMEEELKATDYLTVEKRLERLAVDLKKMKSKELQEESDLLHKLKAFLEAGKALRLYPFSEGEAVQVRGFRFLSAKPLLHLVNADENTLRSHAGLAAPARDGRCTALFAGRIERELLELAPEERAVFQREYGLDGYRYIRDGFIQTSYSLMDLISFFTVGKDETRAWTVEKGTNAFVAAGKIHSDIQKGFIRAEVISWSDFLECGGFAHAKEKGRLRLEGKEYAVQDGEIVHFRFNT